MPMPKIEAIQQTKGTAVYTDDIPCSPDTVHACLVLAPQGQGSFTIDTTAAQNMPGFIAFYSSKDIPAANNVWACGTLFATGTVDYAGHCVGVVVAQTYHQAKNAADAVVVSVALGPANVISMAAAVNGGSVFPNPPPLPPITRGDSAAAMKVAKHTASGVVQIGYQYHFHLEHHVMYVIPQEDVLEVHAATQMPVAVQQEIAQVAGVPCSKVVVTTKRCGGGYGGRITSSLLPAGVAALVATKLNLPVRLQIGMHETMRTLGGRAGVYMTYNVGFDDAGKITAFEPTVYTVCGVNNTDGYGSAQVTMHNLDNAYYIPNITINGVLTKTNIPAVAPVRGPGWVQAIGLMESVISTVASTIQLHPHDVREANFFQRGQSTADGMLLPFWNMQDIWSQLKASANYTQRRANVDNFNAENRWIKRGLGLTPVRFGIGISGGNFDSMVNVYPDGTVGVSHGGCEIGQGINTKVIQVVAMKFGLPDVSTVTCNATTTRVISGASNVTGGSVTSELCSLSIMHACDQINRRLAPFRGSGVPFAVAVGNASQAGVELSAAGWSYSPPAPPTGIFNYNSTSAALTEVEVDVLTGQFFVRQVDILFDCGKSMNPLIDVGQVEGGFVFGMGYYTQEVCTWDQTTGAAQNAGTWEYKPPSVADCPEVFNTALLKNSPNPFGILSSKACGEPGVALASSVVAGIEDAVTAAQREVNPAAKRWVCQKLPLLVPDVMAACSVQASQLTFTA